MIYVFRSADGHEIEVERSMHDAPKIGSRVVRNGKAYRRIPSIGSGPAIIRDRPHLAGSAPRAWTPIKGQPGRTLRDLYPKWGPHGKAAIESAEDKRRFSDALQKAKPRNGWKYDP